MSEQSKRPKIINDQKVKAKKEWVCSACGSLIFKTQTHRKIVWRDAEIARHDQGGRGFHYDHVHLRCWPEDGVTA